MDTTWRGRRRQGTGRWIGKISIRAFLDYPSFGLPDELEEGTTSESATVVRRLSGGCSDHRGECLLGNNIDEEIPLCSQVIPMAANVVLSGSE